MANLRKFLHISKFLSINMQFWINILCLMQIFNYNEGIFLLQALEYMLQALKHTFQGSKHVFQGLKHKIV